MKEFVSIEIVELNQNFVKERDELLDEIERLKGLQKDKEGEMAVLSVEMEAESAKVEPKQAEVTAQVKKNNLLRGTQKDLKIDQQHLKKQIED